MIISTMGKPVQSLRCVTLLLYVLLCWRASNANYERHYQSYAPPSNYRGFFSIDSIPPNYHIHNGHDVHVDVIPSQQSIREGREAVIQCRAQGHPTPSLRWTKIGGRLPSGATDFNGRLTIPHVRQSDSGTYVCTGATGSRTVEGRAEIIVQPYGPILEQTGPGRCMSGEKTCNNGECVKLEYVCDGERDCRDGSDELNCPAPKACEPNEHVCDNKRCVQKMWLCDGDDDCGDGSDERNCAARKPGDVCKSTEFQCRTQEQCIPQAYQCDGQNDCFDGSDEVGCAKPTIVEPPVPNLRVQRGETITITCRAVGVPTPFINWRLNWGPVCPPPRCTQTSVDGFGTLRITDARGSDSGAYTCEAINVQGRILATPDCIVVVVEGAQCNPAGSLSMTPDARGQCPCKLHVTGQTCDRCQPQSFWLNQANPHGCIKCFCSGITQECASTRWQRTQARLQFNNDNQGVTLSNFNEDARSILQNPRLELRPRGMITYSDPHSEILYWRLPKSMLGNKITAYGGKLTIKFLFVGTGTITREPLIVLRGNDITLVHRRMAGQTGPRYDPNYAHTIEFDMYESHWEREDGQPATREHLLMTLADLSSFLIRATHVDPRSQTSTSLGEVTMEIAVNRDTQQVQAFAVEECRCPPGYVGLSCEDCAPGYERSQGGLYLGTCVPARPRDECNAVGAINRVPDPRTGRCICKAYTVGEKCDRCAPNSFWLSPTNPNGCIACFCSGVTQDCTSSNLFRTQERLDFGQEQSDVGIRSFDAQNPFRPRASPVVDLRSRALSFSEFYDAPGGRALYWELPTQFLADKVSSYGGNIKFVFTFSGDGAPNNEPAIVLRGNDITLLYNHRERIDPDRDVVIQISFYESQWRREDGNAVTREHLLMTLADLNQVLLKLTYVQNMRSISLKEVSMDYAVEQNTNQERAMAVEDCRCPPGYKGTSCEDCDIGYARSGGGLYLGLCEKCNCYGHATSCDTEFGICINCQHNTEGDNCERCKAGYEGDATRGTPYDCRQRPEPIRCFCYNHSPRGCDSAGRCLFCEYNTEGRQCEKCKAGFYGEATRGTVDDCKPCPCPGQRECFLDRDGQVTCRQCPPGYSGRLCNECAPGYMRDPRDPSKCKSIGSTAPTIRIEPTDRWDGKAGESFTFQAIVTGNPPPVVTWFREDRQPFPQNIEDTGDGYLRINGAKLSETGRYVASAVNSLGRADAVAMVVIGPSVSIQIRSNRPIERGVIRVAEGEPLEIECRASGDPDPTIEWFRDRGPSRGDVPEGFTPAVIDRYYVRHPKVTAYNAGEYRCRASNSQASAEETVTVEVITTARRPVLILGGSAQYFDDGSLVELQCVAPGPMDDILYWSRLNGQMPFNDPEPPNGILRISDFSSDWEGDYECQARKKNGEVISSVKTTLGLSAADRRHVVKVQGPTVRVVTEGESVSLTCEVPAQVIGSIFPSDYKPEFRWVLSRYGKEVPILGYDTGPLLSLMDLQLGDAGEYRCQFGPTFGRGEWITYSLWNIFISQSEVTGEYREDYALDQPGELGADVEIVCPVYFVPGMQVSFKKLDGDLPAKVIQENNRLKISNFSLTDLGRYECKADMGQGLYAFGYISAILEDVKGTISVFIEVSDEYVSLGDDVTFSCRVTGDDTATLTWKRQTGKPLPASSERVDDSLILKDVKEEDSDVYLCQANTRTGILTTNAVLNIRSNQEAGVRSVSTNANLQTSIGTLVSLSCPIQLAKSPEGRVKWSKVDGELPESAKSYAGILLIENVQKNDSGMYSCELLQNGRPLASVQVWLNVTDFVPAFTSMGYVEMGPLPREAVEEYEIQFSFKPESENGLLYYAPAPESEDGDATNFVAIGLRDGKVVYRYNLGSETAEMESSNVVEMGQWHTVVIKRKGKEGTLIVNEEDLSTGSAEGDRSQLKLGETVYLGGVKDESTIGFNTVGFREGFEGIISEYIVNGALTNIGEEMVTSHGVSQAKVCIDSPCLNDGQCIPGHEPQGYMCQCSPGWLGFNCGRAGCIPDVTCGKGTCVPDPLTGFYCLCPLNTTGVSCAVPQTVTGSPYFDGRGSFLSVARSDMRSSSSLTLRIRPESLDDSLLYYASSGSDGTGDYIGLAIEDGSLVYSYDLGGGPVSIKSDIPLEKDEWFQISTSRTGQDGTLTVGKGRHVFEGRAPGDMKDVDLETNLFFGGVNFGMTLPESFQFSRSFKGCITSPVTRNKTEVDLIASHISGANISPCPFLDACSSNPCRENADCISGDDGSYQCECPDESGCEKPADLCSEKPVDHCGSHGKCVTLNSTHTKCKCDVGWDGDICQIAKPVERQGYFNGDSWIQFRADLLAHSSSEEEEIIELAFTTDAEDGGVILWQGMDAKESGADKDYLTLGLTPDGQLEFSYELGGGPSQLVTVEKVNDGNKHTVKLVRKGKNGQLIIDDMEPVVGKSEGILELLNSDGDYFIGGVPELEDSTFGKHKKNFVGCIGEVRFNGKDINFQEQRVGGQNVVPCPIELRKRTAYQRRRRYHILGYSWL